MSNKIPNKSYIILLSISVVITFCSFFVQESRWNTIVASIGASGIASVCVAWLIDARATKIRVIDNKAKADELMNQFVRIYRRLLWVTANECYGYFCRDECRSFQSWLSLLCSLESVSSKEGQKSMRTRCLRVSANLENLQRQIEIFRSQNATLIFAEFPNYEQALEALDTIWIHCWGTLKCLETENYKAFCETTYIIFTDFINAFPQYKNHFPVEYSVQTFAP